MVNHDRRSKLLDSYENAAVIVSGIDAGDLGQPTPCRKYDVAGLVDHIVEAGHRAAALGRGQAPHPETVPPRGAVRRARSATPRCRGRGAGMGRRLQVVIEVHHAVG